MWRISRWDQIHLNRMKLRVKLDFEASAVHRVIAGINVRFLHTLPSALTDLCHALHACRSMSCLLRHSRTCRLWLCSVSLLWQPQTLRDSC